MCYIHGKNSVHATKPLKCSTNQYFTRSVNIINWQDRMVIFYILHNNSNITNNSQYIYECKTFYLNFLCYTTFRKITTQITRLIVIQIAPLKEFSIARCFLITHLLICNCPLLQYISFFVSLGQFQNFQRSNRAIYPKPLS